MATHTLRTPDVDLVYDVHGPLPTADGRRPLVLIGQPMDASGFTALVSQLPDRTTVTYDPRGMGRSVRKDGRVDNDPEVQAADVAASSSALGVGPVDMFASSGGAVTALALVAAHPDARARRWSPTSHRCSRCSRMPRPPYAGRISSGHVRGRRLGRGDGRVHRLHVMAGRAHRRRTSSSRRPTRRASGCPPTTTAGATIRCCRIARGRSRATARTSPHSAAAPTRVVVAVGEESLNLLTGRTAEATARLLGQEPTVFPSHHGGFMGGEFGYAGQPEAFALRLARGPRRRRLSAPAEGTATRIDARLGSSNPFDRCPGPW